MKTYRQRVNILNSEVSAMYLQHYKLLVFLVSSVIISASCVIKNLLALRELKMRAKLLYPLKETVALQKIPTLRVFNDIKTCMKESDHLSNLPAMYLRHYQLLVSWSPQSSFQLLVL